RHEVRRVRVRQLRDGAGGGRRVHVADVAPRAPARRPGRRRRQVLALTMTDLSPRTGPTDAPVSPRVRRKWLPIVVLGLVLVAACVLVTQCLRSAVDYYCNVDEVGTRSGCDADRRLRVQGVVEQGSIESITGGTEFSIRFNGVSLPVDYSG